MFDVMYFIMFIAGIVVGYILDRLSNGRTGKSGSSGSASDATAAARFQQLEEAITGAEQANAGAVKTLENIQDFIHSVRDSNGNHTSDVETE